jgi:hypothetical protein
MHNNMLDSVANARMAFFDGTPIGRVLNRFSGDIGMYMKPFRISMHWAFSDAVHVPCNECRQPDFSDVSRGVFDSGWGFGMRGRIRDLAAIMSNRSY